MTCVYATSQTYKLMSPTIAQLALLVVSDVTFQRIRFCCSLLFGFILRETADGTYNSVQTARMTAATPAVGSSKALDSENCSLLI